eukprot:scaffold1058_cov155-Ochromonas_danica.AAC.27
MLGDRTSNSTVDTSGPRPPCTSTTSSAITPETPFNWLDPFQQRMARKEFCAVVIATAASQAEWKCWKATSAAGTSKPTPSIH